MPDLIYLVVGIIAGGVIVGIVMHYRARGVIQEKVSQTEARAQGAESTVIELRNQATALLGELQDTRKALTDEGKERVAAETQVAEARKSFEEQKRLLADAENRLRDTFKALSADVFRENAEEFRSRAGELVKPLREALDRYERQIADLERSREGAYEGLGTKIEALARAHRSLEQQTQSLTQALRSPTVRGRWGEITLQRVVELAGLSEYCDFDTQAQVDAADSRQRPDLVVRLPGGRSIVVDSKVPLEAYMDAMETEDAELRRQKLSAHAAAVRTQVKTLSQKSYWSQFASAPEFVILFLPGESFFSAALEADRSLIDDGIRSRVILATPTTLIMALLTVAHSWQQQQLAENAQRIAEAGTDLYGRLCTFTRHLDGVGKGVRSALEKYNAAVGSWEHSVEPGARKLKELGAAKPDQELTELDRTDTSMRQLPPAGGGNDE